jgi:pimeloyl-ACP methyl ester carboxylesterase
MRQREVTTNGVRLRVTEAGEGPLVVLLHGFPESAHSWRHQLRALAQAGYHAVAPDQRGYATSDAPPAIEAYDQVELAADVAGLIGACGGRQAVVVGHDWGAPVAYHTALLHPEHVRAVVGMSVPWGGRPPNPPLPRLREIFKDVFFYMIYFQTPSVAETELEADVRRSLRTFYYSASGDVPRGGGFTPHPPGARLLETMTDCGDALPAWLAPEDLDMYVAEFTRSGFRGPLNWYRNFDRTWERTASLAGRTIDQPALFLAGERDPVLAFTRGQFERMRAAMPQLTDTIVLDGCGHWIQQERPDAVNAALLKFLRGLPGPD